MSSGKSAEVEVSSYRSAEIEVKIQVQSHSSAHAAVGSQSLPATVPELITAQAVLTPDAQAIVCCSGALTYGELEQRANQLANHLIRVGVTRDVPVAVCLDRSPAFIVAALGILKAGGAYIPLDPAYPAKRISFMIEDSAHIVITDSSKRERLPHTHDRMYLDIHDPAIAGEEVALTREQPSPDDLAYIIYTSGSTGQPKGVQITHSALLNLVSWHRRASAMTKTDRASQVASIGFDAAVWEMWPCLTAGATLFMVDDDRRSDAGALRDWLLMNHITIAFVPTPIAEHMMRLPWPAVAPLRLLLTGGDKLHRHPRPGLPFTLVNNYGLTETTVVASSGEVQPAETSEDPSIGYPIDNTKIYILDERLQLVPQGMTGEIYIGGAGLARGYVNRPELTAAKFVANPFSADPGDRLYRTGDLGCYRSNGEIAFCGRNDDQIKIRGYRIEPSEIVAALNQYPSIQASAAKAVEREPGEQQLIAYIVATAGASPTGAELREFLRQRLPEYMVPSTFVEMQALPLTVNGKLDRDALPYPTPANMLRNGNSATSATAVQKRLLSILGQLLQLRDINLGDNFFLLGGHSLLGAQLIAKVKEAFGVELTLIDLFDNGTVSAMAEQIERLLNPQVSSASPVS